MPRSKSRYGDGRVYESPKGSGIWFYRWYEQGKPHTYRCKGKTSAERKRDGLAKQAIVLDARSRQAEARVEAEYQGLNVDKSLQSLQMFYDTEWLPACMMRNLAPLTLYDYKHTIETYILPNIGYHKLKDISVVMVFELHTKITSDKSPAMASRVIAKLGMILASAKRRRYILYNAVEDARPELPTYSADEKIPLTVEETRGLFNTIEEDKTISRKLFYYLALTYGFRLGELLGLMWKDIDWDKRTISISRQIQEVSGKRSLREDTKTDAGERVVPLTERIYFRMLAEFEQSRYPDGFLFCTDEGQPLTPSNVGRSWRGTENTGKYTADRSRKTILVGVRQKANLPDYITIHNFRHTVATRLMELGTPDEIRDAIMGHGKKGIRAHYSHATLDSMRIALEEMEAQLWGNAGTNETDTKIAETLRPPDQFIDVIMELAGIKEALRELTNVLRGQG